MMVGQAIAWCQRAVQLHDGGLLPFKTTGVDTLKVHLLDRRLVALYRDDLWASLIAIWRVVVADVGQSDDTIRSFDSLGGTCLGSASIIKCSSRLLILQPIPYLQSQAILSGLLMRLLIDLLRALFLPKCMGETLLESSFTQRCLLTSKEATVPTFIIFLG